MLNQQCHIVVKTGRIIFASQDCFGAGTIATKSKLIHQWSDRKWSAMRLTKMHTVPLLQLEQNFSRNFYLFPFLTLFRILSWVKRYFNPRDSLTLMRRPKHLQFPKQLLNILGFLEATKPLALLFITLKWGRGQCFDAFATLSLSVLDTRVDNILDDALSLSQFDRTLLNSHGGG